MVAAKVRADSWAALLTPEQQWALYDHHYQVVHGKWELSAAWAEKEFKLTRRPSRAAFYEWKAQMDELEAVRAEEIRNVTSERIANAAEGIDIADEKIKRALLAEAMNRALIERNPEAAERFIKMTTALINCDLKKTDLALAREKFEFDAAKKAMELAAEIKTVSADDSLDEDDKIQKVREALFG